MVLLRHKQRAITAVTAPNAPWINPSKFGGDDPLPTLDVPSVFYNLNLDAGVNNSGWFLDGALPQPTYDTTGPFLITAKFRVDAVGTANQVLWFSGNATDKRLMLRFSAQDVQWSDGGVTYNFVSVGWVINQWYLLQIEGFGDGDKVICSLQELPTGTHVTGSPQTHGTNQTGTVTTDQWRIGDSSPSPPLLAFNGDLADLRLYESGKLVHHTPIDEGGAATIVTERIRNQASLAINGTGNWVPILVFASLSLFSEQLGFTGGTNQAIISASQFKAETGQDPPPDHTTDILKIVCMEENTTVQMEYVVADDPSGWASWCPRYYIDKPSYDSLKIGPGAIQMRMRAAVGNVHTRGLQASVAGLSNAGLNMPIFDPNDQDWIVGAAADNPQNFGVQHQGGYTPGPTTKFEITIVTPPAASGFVAPTTVYIFDWLRDVGHSNDKMKVVIGWDDSAADTFLFIDGLANTYGIKNTLLHQSSGFPGAGTAGEKLTLPQADTLAGNGRWEFVGHADVHTNYETRLAADVQTDIQNNVDDIIARGWGDDGARIGSTPQNGHYRTVDGDDIAGLQANAGRTTARKGHWGAFVANQGLANPFKVGTFSLGQGGPPTVTSGVNLINYNNWARVHTTMKAMNTSYMTQGHTIADDSALPGTPAPVDLEFAFSELELIFADLAADQAAGILDTVFFSEFARHMGHKV